MVLCFRRFVVFEVILNASVKGELREKDGIGRPTSKQELETKYVSARDSLQLSMDNSYVVSVKGRCAQLLAESRGCTVPGLENAVATAPWWITSVGDRHRGTLIGTNGT
jgi:hypothetical protein